MAVLKPHLALTVTDVDRSLPFYRALFGAEPAKVRPGYAKFELADPALNFTLNEGERAGLGALNHAGLQVASTDEVVAARDRLKGAGLATFDELDTTCCWARQDKIWVHDPDGTPWEVFAVLEDADTARGEPAPAAGACACGCGDAAEADAEAVQAAGCSLDARELADRRETVAALRPALVTLDAGADRLEATFAPGVEDAVEALVAAEAACCSFMRAEWDPGAGRLVLAVPEERHRPALAAIATALAEPA